MGKISQSQPPMYKKTIVIYSVFVFTDNTGYPNQIRDLLDATLTPSLTYLAGIDDSIFQPFYEEIFDLIDEFILQFSRIRY